MTILETIIAIGWPLLAILYCTNRWIVPLIWGRFDPE